MLEIYDDIYLKYFVQTCFIINSKYFKSLLFALSSLKSDFLKNL